MPELSNAAIPVTLRPTPAPASPRSNTKRNAVRQAERRLVVYLDEAQRRWLRSVEADALLDGVRLSASAMVRLAIDELRSRRVGWEELAARLPGEGGASEAP